MKPTVAEGYDNVVTQNCERVLVTLLRGLGPWKDSVYLVGGLAPRYLITARPPDVPAHAGTGDVDIVVEMQMLADTEAYHSLEENLRKLGFARAENAKGEKVSWRWERKIDGSATIILELLADDPKLGGGKVQPLPTEGNISALNIPHASMVFDLHEKKDISAELLDDNGLATETIRHADIVCFTCLKAFALDQRYERKDAHDLVYCIEHFEAGLEAVAEAFKAALAGKHERQSGHGKMLVRDEPNASILQEALEGYAIGRFETQVEVKRFLERQPSFPKCLPNGEIRNQRIHDILTRTVYAGYIEALNWGITFRKGHHEGLISLETFERIQERLKGNAKAPARKDINADFPLRGFILCNDCGKPLTACWSKGKMGVKYPYYLCATKDCESYRKSIKRDRLEGEFEEILERLEPSETLHRLARMMFEDAWRARLSQAKDAARTAQAKLNGIEKQIDQLLDRIVEASNQSVGKITDWNGRGRCSDWPFWSLFRSAGIRDFEPLKYRCLSRL